MADTRIIRIGAPWRGRQSKTALSDHPEGFVYSSMNVWPYDYLTGRTRLSACPGFETFGSTSNTNLIAVLNVAADADGTPTPTSSGRQLMIGRAGNLYKHTTGTSFTNIGDAVDTGRNVQAASYRNKLYIANATKDYKVYSYETDAVTTWTASPGTLPADCLLICTWGPRLVLAGAADAPHVVNFSRVDEPNDWDTAETDTGAAVSVPNINEPVTALIPHSKDCLICGTHDSCWIFRGNPMRGGTLERFAHVVGPINATAWCKDDNDYTYMLTRSGLFRMAPGCGTPPVSISWNVIPDALVGLLASGSDAYLEYDTLFRCVHIYIDGGDPAYHYFPPESGLEGGSFWPVEVPNEQLSVTAIGRFSPIEDTDTSGVLIGSPNAALVRLGPDGTKLAESDIQIIFPMAEPGGRAMLQEASVVFGSNTVDNPYVRFYAAETAEEVVSLPSTRKYLTTYVTLLANHHRCFPRVCDEWGLVRVVQDDNTEHLTLERVALMTSPFGKGRD